MKNHIRSCEIVFYILVGYLWCVPLSGLAAEYKRDEMLVATTNPGFVKNIEYRVPMGVWNEVKELKIEVPSDILNATIGDLLVWCNKTAASAKVKVRFVVYVDPSDESSVELLLKTPLSKLKAIFERKGVSLREGVNRLDIKGAVLFLQEGAGTSGVFYIPGCIVLTPSIASP